MCYWKITRDHEFERNEKAYPGSSLNLPNRVGTVGPRGADETLPLTVQFKLYDDDGNVMYQGMAADDDSVELAHDFGMADAGCTRSTVRYGTGPWQEFIS